MSKSFLKLLVVLVVIFSFETFLIWANFSTVCIMYDGSLDFPLYGKGAKYGESVSTNSLSIGIEETVSASSVEFLKVIIPLTEM